MNCSTDTVRLQSNLYDLALGMDGTSGEKNRWQAALFGRLEIDRHSLTLFSEFPDTL